MSERRDDLSPLMEAVRFGRPLQPTPGPALLEGGVPAKTPEPLAMNATVITGLVAVAVFMVCAVIVLVSMNRAGGLAVDSGVPAGPVAIANMDPGIVRERCERAARDKLRTPNSFRTVYGAPAPKWYGDHWGYAEEFDAQNAVGVKIRSTLACVVKGTTADDARANVDFVSR